MTDTNFLRVKSLVSGLPDHASSSFFNQLLVLARIEKELIETCHRSGIPLNPIAANVFPANLLRYSPPKSLIGRFLGSCSFLKVVQLKGIRSVYARGF